MKGGKQMNFASALFSLKRGFKIKRHDWIGYWVLEDNKVMIHLKNGHVMNLVDSDDIVFTLENMACDDWEVVTDPSNVGLPKCPSVPITISPAYIKKPNRYEYLKVKDECKDAESDTKAYKETLKVGDFDTALKMTDDHCKVIGNMYDSHSSVIGDKNVIAKASHNHCHASTCNNIAGNTLKDITATDEYGRTDSTKDFLAREFLMEPSRATISQNESINDNGIYASVNDQPVNDEAINESVSDEPVNDEGIYERPDSKTAQLHKALFMNYEKLTPKYKSDFCRFDGSKWIPTDSKVASDMLTTLGNYKLCYNVNGEWVPWNKLYEVTK